MGVISDRLEELGLSLPEPLQVPEGLVLPFSWVRVQGDRAYVSGHVPTNLDGSIAEPLGKVGADVTPEQAIESARKVALGMIGSLERELGDLDRIRGWLRVFSMVNCAPGFTNTAHFANGFSELIVEIFGKEKGIHARSAVGMAELPFSIPVEFEAEVLIA